MKKKLVLLALLPIMGLTACQSAQEFKSYVRYEKGLPTVYNAADPEMTTFLLLGDYGYINFTNPDGSITKLEGGDMRTAGYDFYHDNAIAWKTGIGGDLPASATVNTTVTGATFRGWVVYNNNIYPDYITKIPEKNFSFVIAIFDGTSGSSSGGQGGGGGGGGGGSPTSNFTSGQAYIVGDHAYNTGTSSEGESWNDATQAYTMLTAEADQYMNAQFKATITFAAGDSWKVRYGDIWPEIGDGHYETSSGALSTGDMVIDGDNIKVVNAGSYDIYFKDYKSGWLATWISAKK